MSVRFFKILTSSLLCCVSTVALAAAPVNSISVGQNESAVTNNLSLQQRVTRLENQIKYLSTLQQSLSQMQYRLNTLQGQFETSQRNNDILSQRLNVLEAVVHLAEASQHSNIINHSKQHFSASETKDFNTAYNLLMQKKYRQAIGSFKHFISEHPKSHLIGDARYWLGELYLVEGQPDQASQEFRKVIANPKNDKAPDAMLKLATIFMAYGDSAHAKEMYQKVINNYAGTSAAEVAKTRMKALTNS